MAQDNYGYYALRGLPELPGKKKRLPSEVLRTGRGACKPRAPSGHRERRAFGDDIRLFLARLMLVVLSGILLGAATACSVRQSTPSGAATIIPFPIASMTPCAQEEIPPKITEIRPVQIQPGSEVTVIASGGYFRDTCGGYDEGSRVYKVYLDDQPIADLSCYVNHCEGKFTLSSSIAAGPHCMGVQKGTCQLELQVAGK